MSQAYYQGYGTQLPTNYNTNGDGSVQHLNYHNPGYVSDEYMRQPATAPYPTAPLDMPQPNATTHHLHHHMQPPPPPPLHHHQQQQQEPQVIIVHQNNEPDCCCECFRFCCSCLNGIVSGVCQLILAIIFFVGIIAIAVYFLKFYKRH